MVDLVFAQQILHKILAEDVSFKKALRDAFKDKEDADSFKRVGALVGCELRHHMLFEHILKQCSEMVTVEQLELAYLVLADRFFLKSFDKDELKSYFDEKIGTMNHKTFDDIYNFEGSPIDLISVPRGSIDFAAIRFNTPRWLVKMWIKHFGKGTTYKILKKNIRPSKQFVSVNTLKTSEEEILKNYPNDFVKSDVSNLLLCNVKSDYRRLPIYKNESIFSLEKPLKELVNKCDHELLNELSVYSASNSNFIEELLVRSKLDKGINLAVPSIEERPEILRLIRVSKARNINLFQAKDEIGMKAGMSNKQELFFVYPKSSGFGKISLYPDYLLHFKREGLDAILEDEAKALELVAPYVIEEGHLIYIVDTINKKESTIVVNNFLNNHPDFEIVEEKQLFPFEESQVSMYYAILKHK